jgi:hypothetical protein
MKKPSGASTLDIPRPEPATTNPYHHCNVLSTFRTHINLPFALFSASNKSNAIPEPKSQSRTQHQHTASAHRVHLQPQPQAHSISPSQHAISYPTKTVETIIWSGDDDESVDPASPKMGTRAYRERERREKQKRESREKAQMTRGVADNVRVEFGLPIQDSGGVEITKELVRSEEAAESSSHQ